MYSSYAVAAALGLESMKRMGKYLGGPLSGKCSSAAASVFNFTRSSIHFSINTSQAPPAAQDVDFTSMIEKHLEVNDSFASHFSARFSMDEISRVSKAIEFFFPICTCG